jgi:hypothetical protein
MIPASDIQLTPPALVAFVFRAEILLTEEWSVVWHRLLSPVGAMKRTTAPTIFGYEMDRRRLIRVGADAPGLSPLKGGTVQTCRALVLTRAAVCSRTVCITHTHGIA